MVRRPGSAARPATDRGGCGLMREELGANSQLCTPWAQARHVPGEQSPNGRVGDSPADSRRSVRRQWDPGSPSEQYPADIENLQDSLKSEDHRDEQMEPVRIPPGQTDSAHRDDDRTTAKHGVSPRHHVRHPIANCIVLPKFTTAPFRFRRPMAPSDSLRQARGYRPAYEARPR